MVDELNGQAIDSMSVVGPAKKLIPETMMAECVVPTAAPSSFRPSEFSLPVAGALQLQKHETSRVVSGIDTTSGQLIVDLIAKGRGQILAPRQHRPRPEFSTREIPNQMSG